MIAADRAIALLLVLAAGCGSGSKTPQDATPPVDVTADRQAPAGVCIGTGGNIMTASCCQVVADYPDTCAVGACGCAPASSHPVMTCSCPTGTCFSPDTGCVGRAGACTPGADQTCNDNPMISSLHGQCTSGGRCVCRPTFAMNPDTGRCL